MAQMRFLAASRWKFHNERGLRWSGQMEPGKTTLLNLLTDRDTPTEGGISIARNTRIGFLPQRPELIGEHTLWEEALTAFADVREMEAKLTRLEEAMADPERYDEALAEYGPLQQEFEHYRRATPMRAASA